MAKKNFNDIEEQFIRDNLFGKTTQELCDLFNKQFNRNISYQTMRDYKLKRGLKSGVNTKFQKKYKPHHYKPAGSEHIKPNGYVIIKIAEPNVWVFKHNYIYEQHYGKIPDDCCVVFADQDKTNFDLDNLILAKKNEQLIANARHLLFKDKELTKTGLLIAKTLNTISEIKKSN